MRTVAKDGFRERLRIGAIPVPYSSADESASLVCCVDSDPEDDEVGGNGADPAYYGDCVGGGQTGQGTTHVETR